MEVSMILFAVPCVVGHGATGAAGGGVRVQEWQVQCSGLHLHWGGGAGHWAGMGKWYVLETCAKHPSLQLFLTDKGSEPKLAKSGPISRKFVFLCGLWSRRSMHSEPAFGSTIVHETKNGHVCHPLCRCAAGGPDRLL